jgi:hypothetical protein
MADVKACPLTWAVVAVTFGSWVIALAGIAGLQQQCDADASESYCFGCCDSMSVTKAGSLLAILNHANCIVDDTIDT